MNFFVQSAVEGLSFRPFPQVSANAAALLWFVPTRLRMFSVQSVQEEKTAVCIAAQH